MITESHLLKFLKKNDGKFITVNVVMKLFKSDKEYAAEVIGYLEKMGYLENLETNNSFWILSQRGKVLIHKTIDREFKVDTLKKHLDELIDRVKIVNASLKYPDYINRLEIVSEYPILNPGKGVYIMYSIKKKGIDDEQYQAISQQLRKEYKRRFENITNYIFYPHTAIIAFLRSRSKVLKLRNIINYSNLNGHVIFNID